MSAEVYKAWTKAYSTFVGPITSTRFMEKGQLTPEEFVGAGDKLVDKCPSWKWCGAADGKEGVHKAMPKDKRFLVMSGARCERRAGDLTGDMGGDVELEGDEEGWTCTHKDHVASKVEEMPSMDEDAAVPAKAEPEELDEDDIPDMDMDMDAEVAVVDEDEDPAAVCTNTVVPARRYDIHILYDNYTYTPRVYLNGYDARCFCCVSMLLFGRGKNSATHTLHTPQIRRDGRASFQRGYVRRHLQRLRGQDCYDRDAPLHRYVAASRSLHVLCGMHGIFTHPAHRSKHGQHPPVQTCRDDEAYDRQAEGGP